MLYQELDVFKQSVQLASDLHKATLQFPSRGGPALAGQIQRASVSIPSNIAEGAMRNSSKEFIQFVAIARGSCAELLTLLAICDGVGYLAEASDFENRVQRIRQMLTALQNSLRAKLPPTKAAKSKA